MRQSIKRNNKKFKKKSKKKIKTNRILRSRKKSKGGNCENLKDKVMNLSSGSYKITELHIQNALKKLEQCADKHDKQRTDEDECSDSLFKLGDTKESDTYDDYAECISKKYCNKEKIDENDEQSVIRMFNICERGGIHNSIKRFAENPYFVWKNKLESIAKKYIQELCERIEPNLLFVYNNKRNLDNKGNFDPKK